MESEYPYRPQAVFEAVCTGGSWVFGCLTALGRIPRLRQPKVRVFAAAITAATQALTFRDVQVTRQRSIQRLLDDRDARLGAWEHTKRVVSVRNSERHDSNFPESFEVWDTKHGKDMLTKQAEVLLFRGHFLQVLGLRHDFGNGMVHIKYVSLLLSLGERDANQQLLF